MTALHFRHGAVALGTTLFLVLASLQAFADGTREECSVCGMWTDQYMITRHVALLNDNPKWSFCSIACLSKYLNEHEGSVRNVLAADFVTEELIDADRAYYVEGSDIPGVMTNTGRVAFPSEEDAARLQEKHGGRIIDFLRALKNLQDQTTGISTQDVQE